MTTPDGVHTIAYNGEIYNHGALRSFLKSRGYQFRGTSDTEVLLYLLREEGIAGFDRLRGMFAVAFWDAEKQELLLARDPYGIKPLYYVDSPDRLAFASEVRALLQAGAARRQLDPIGVESYLAFGCVAQPRTIIRDVHSLAPGSYLRRCLRSRAVVSRHYEFPHPTANAPRTYQEAVEQTSALLRRVVNEHMVADVPVGVLLSGGIDSSGLVAQLAGENRAVDTFSVIFEGEDESLSERVFAAEVAKQFASRHHEVSVGGSIVELVKDAVAHLDRPSIDGVNTYLVCQAVRGAGISVVQSGLGADEVFLGYGTHRAFAGMLRLAPALQLGLLGRLATVVGRLPGFGTSYRVQKALSYLGTDGSPASAYGALRGLFPPSAISSLLGRPAQPPSAFVSALPGTESLDSASQLSAYEITNYMSNMLLRDSDAMSMAHGLELRVPYLDRDLLEAVVGLPAALKLRPGRPKPLLVDSLRPPLPRTVVERRKRGFVLPFARWLRMDLRRELTDSLLDAPRMDALGLMPTAVRSVWNDYLTRGEESAWTRPWAIHVLSQWASSEGVSG